MGATKATLKRKVFRVFLIAITSLHYFVRVVK